MSIQTPFSCSLLCPTSNHHVCPFSFLSTSQTHFLLSLTFSFFPEFLLLSLSFTFFLSSSSSPSSTLSSSTVFSFCFFLYYFYCYYQVLPGLSFAHKDSSISTWGTPESRLEQGGVARMPIRGVGTSWRKVTSFNTFYTDIFSFSIFIALVSNLGPII